MDERHTRAFGKPLITDQAARAARETANGVRQFDAVKAEIAKAIERRDAYRLRPSTILGLHRIAVEGIEASAGQWRNVPVGIEGSRHEPPHESRVPELMEELCDYVNANFKTMSPLDLAAYTLWRICWIHPFSDGNGRTARAVSYLVLCAAMETQLPGRSTIPELIVDNKAPYYQALEAVDETVDADGDLDLAPMRDYFQALFAKQLVDLHKAAKGD